MSRAVRHDPQSAGDHECINAVPKQESNHEQGIEEDRTAGCYQPRTVCRQRDGPAIQLHSTLAGNNPDIVIGGVQSAGSPWTVKSGFASLDASGKLHVRVRDLILPATGDAGP